jgi:predicted O-methyltransferase YrrM
VASVGNTVTRTASLKVRLRTQRRTTAPTQSWIKRCVVNCARKLHDLPYTFPLLTRAFRMLQGAGLNVTPNHFYWPIPDLAQLEKRDWQIYSPPPTCRFELKRQMELAQELAANYGEEWQFSNEESDGEYHYNNGYFETVDAEVAYGMVRYFKPKRVIEIGTGFSTRLLAAALQHNHERDEIDGQLISVDPYPERFPANQWSHRVAQVPAVVQEVELELFDTLQANDILFIDSSHVVATGSDVLREYLEILPRLKSGVVIHVHDIFLPSDYPRNAVLENLWFWSEQYLLQAFLSFNPKFEVLWGSSAMQSQCSWILDECFPNWRHSYRQMPQSKRRFVPTADGDRVWPSSFWMRRL